jgi:VWFA-related protein
LLAACRLWAQAAAPPPLVHLYPAALDSSGQPATGLTAEDFKIADNGKAQTILFFRRPSAKAPAALGPHEYTNRPAGVTPHSTAILFDLLNEVQSNRLDTWHRLAKSVPQLAAGEQVYFYVLNLDGDLLPVLPITPQAGERGPFDKELDKVMEKASLARPAGLDGEDRAKRTYHQIEVLSNQLATLPGRRDIVWITNAMPSITNSIHCAGDRVECGLYVAHLAVTLERDGAAVNPDYDSAAPLPTVSYDLEQMALLTGGRAYFLQDIREIVKQIARNAANQYEIVYAPSAANWDNKFHKIRIACARKGVKLQVRERYYALPDSRSAADRQKEALIAASERVSDTADIGLGVKVTPTAKGVHLEIQVDTADLLLREQGGKFAGALTLVLSDREAADSDSAGLQLRPIGAPAVQSFALEMTKERHDNMAPEEIQLDHAIGETVYRVRLMVMDANSNAIGSLTFPVR